MSKLMISVAGIRGIVGETLLAEEFLRYTLAYAATRKPGTIVVGGDTRISRHMLRHLVFGALESSGLEVLDLGICPTPTVGLMVRETGATGGIAITASHNPAQWNALKFFTAEGTFLTPPEFKRVMAAFESGKFRRAAYDRLGRLLQHPDPVGPHLRRIEKIIDMRVIRRRRLKIVVDCCNGAATAIIPRLAQMMGVQPEFIFTDTTIPFERVAEPLPENIGALCRAVQATGADVGFAIDPDADRLALVDETGRPIGEERTLTLVSNHWLAREKTPLVANLSTTRALDDVAARHGVKIHRTPIGEAHVVAQMKKVKSAIGGEGNGGVILPAVHAGRDAATGVALVCEMLASRKMSLSELNAEIPDYAIVKDKIPLGKRSVQDMLPKIEKAMPKPVARVTTDGLKLVYGNGWVHIRPSGTEPIIRIFAEAPTAEMAGQWIQVMRSAVK